MNASAEKRTRLACRVVRVWAAIRERETGLADASLEAGLPAATLKHMAGCADCQRFFVESRSLGRALVRDVVRERQPIPEGLDRRVSLAVARSRPPRTGAFPRLAIAACGVAAVTLGVILAERGFRAVKGGQAARRDATEATVRNSCLCSFQRLMVTRVWLVVRSRMAASCSRAASMPVRRDSVSAVLRSNSVGCGSPATCRPASFPSVEALRPTIGEVGAASRLGRGLFLPVTVPLPLQSVALSRPMV